jgi:hypothetical protein
VEGAHFLAFLNNSGNNPFEIFKNIASRYSYHFKSLRAEHGVARGIAHRLIAAIVSFAIDLDD